MLSLEHQEGLPDRITGAPQAAETGSSVALTFGGHHANDHASRRHYVTRYVGRLRTRRRLRKVLPTKALRHGTAGLDELLHAEVRTQLRNDPIKEKGQVELLP